jgi:hypothetical protein
MSDLLDQLSTYSDPFFLVGDLNIHVERRNDHHAISLLEMMLAYGLECQVD